MRVFVPFLIGFHLMFSSFAVAQDGSMTVQVETVGDGKTTSREKQSFDQANFSIRDFLLAKQDGAIRLYENGEMLLELRVSGDQVQVTNEGETHTTTVSAALASLEKARAVGHMTACKSKQKTIASALEMWAMEHRGRYPENLAQLVPEYLDVMINCTDVEGQDTYGPLYRVRRDPDHFVLQCTVDHTGAEIGAGLPAYDSDFGLIEKESDFKQYFRP